MLILTVTQKMRMHSKLSSIRHREDTALSAAGTPGLLLKPLDNLPWPEFAASVRPRAPPAEHQLLGEPVGGRYYSSAVREVRSPPSWRLGFRCDASVPLPLSAYG